MQYRPSTEETKVEQEVWAQPGQTMRKQQQQKQWIRYFKASTTSYALLPVANNALCLKPHRNQALALGDASICRTFPFYLTCPCMSGTWPKVDAQTPHLPKELTEIWNQLCLKGDNGIAVGVCLWFKSPFTERSGRQMRFPALFGSWIFKESLQDPGSSVRMVANLINYSELGKRFFGIQEIYGLRQNQFLYVLKGGSSTCTLLAHPTVLANQLS